MIIFVGSACILVLAVLFGGYFTDIPEEDGVQLGSGKMFDKIAEYYDGMNTIMSLNQHMTWKNQLVDTMNLRASDRILDLATGTGDIALLQAHRYRYMLADAMNHEKREDISELMNRVIITGMDPSRNMLEKAVAKSNELGHHDVVDFTEGNAMHLDHIGDNTFSKISMSFGIRNVEDRNKALLEMRRVLMKKEFKTNSDHSLYIMEFVRPTEGYLAPLVSAFIEYIIPALGAFAEDYSCVKSFFIHLMLIIASFPFCSLLYCQATFAPLAACHRNINT